MFDGLQKRLAGALQKVRGRSTIQESDVEAVLSEIRTGLLESDVHFRVTKDFLARVKERCLQADVIKSLSPEQQILRVLNEELTRILGGHNRELDFSVTPPAVFLVCGLQGSGKTTTCAKLALHLKNSGKRVGLVSIDVYRPAAIDQLATLAKKFDIPVVASTANEKPQDIAKRALKEASQLNLDLLIVDTAGRLQIDEALMSELKDVHALLKPTETLLVIDAMMGQQAVEVAEGFDRTLGITGSILTKLDGDSRGGAALSLVSVTGKPIKFIGVGERPTDLESFHPDRMASRLLDMGDVLSLLERAQTVITEDEAQAAAQKLGNFDNFTLEDFRDQMRMVSRMGPISGLLKMMPGMGALKEQLDSVDTDKEFRRVNAILDSMTATERRQPELLNGSRRARIARGAGVEVSEVNSLVKRFLEARKAMKKMGKMGSMLKGMMAGQGGAPGAMPGNLPPGFGPPRGGKGFGRKF